MTTISSATVADNARHTLVVALSGSATCTALTGLALLMPAGAQRSLISISGSGTSTLTFGLDGDLAELDVAYLQVAAGAISAVSAVTVAVTNDVADGAGGTPTRPLASGDGPGTQPTTSGAVTVIPWASAVVMQSGTWRTTWDGGAAPIDLTKAASGHYDGSEGTILIPASTATALFLSPDLNVTGDVVIDPTTYEADIDPSLAHVIALAQIGTDTVGVLREIAAPDATAPTLVSATVAAGDPNALVCVFSEPVVATITGLTTPFTVGTARTITAVESGNGTTTVTFTLSGNISSGDTFKLVIGSTRTTADFAGNLVATNGSGTSVTLSGFALPGLAGAAAHTLCFERNVAMSPASGTGNIVSWTDGMVGTKQAAPADAGHATRTTTGGVAFTADGTKRLHVTGITALGVGGWGIYCRVAAAVGSPTWACFSFNTDGVATAPNITLTLAGGAGTGAILTTDTDDGAGHTVFTGVGSLTVDATTYHEVFLGYDGTDVACWIDGVNHPITTAFDASGITTITIGCEVTSGTTPARLGAGEVTDLTYKATAAYTGPERTAIAAYIAGRP